jgi:hypothetical protein
MHSILKTRGATLLDEPEQSAVEPTQAGGRRFSKEDVVQVRPWSEILLTLDAAGTTEGLPFMPEMIKYCGATLTITNRLERTCEDVEGGMRRIRNVVFLNDLRCDGAAHGGCQKGCCILWKDAWLRKPIETSPEFKSVPAGNVPYPFPFVFEDRRYTCQSTELLRATSHLSPLDVRSYVRDLRSKTYSPAEMLRMTCHAVAQRIRCRITGKSHQFLEGTCSKTPRQALDLRPGELVRVKSADKIALTVNREGKNRGLVFTAGMLPYCGRTFKVLRRMEKMIHEPTGQLIDVQGTVILENVTCQGIQSVRGGCPKNNFYYWREIWLERV